MAKGAGLRGQSARDFSGGPNIRDAASELAPSEILDSFNIGFDERGGAVSRLGYVKLNGSVYGGGLVQKLYPSSVAAATIVQAGASLYKGTSTVANKTFSTAARVGMVDFAGKLFVQHPVDGLFSSTDGVTFAAVADPDAPKGNTLAVWQNKLYSAGDPTNKSRVSWSNAGDGTNWTNTDFNELRSVDNEQVVALKVAPGLDILGRAGLFACKQESAYRIYDATTGAYEVVDATVGAGSAEAIVAVGAKVLTISKHGIFSWQSGQVGMQNVSDRDAPLWDPGQINLSKLDLFCAGRKKNRAVFSVCRAGSTANDLSLEYHPEQGWVAPGSNAMSCYATTTGTVEALLGGSPNVSGQAYTLDSGGSDAGAAISWRLQTKWLEPNGGFLLSLWQLKIHGRGTGTLTMLRDFVVSGGDSQAFDMTTPQVFYDTGVLYDSGATYNVTTYQITEPFFSLGVCRQFSLKFEGTSTTTTVGRQVFGAGTPPDVGFFALYGFEYVNTPLALD